LGNIVSKIENLLTDYKNPPHIRSESEENMAMKEIEDYFNSKDFTWSDFESIGNLLPADLYGMVVSGMANTKKEETINYIFNIISEYKSDIPTNGLKKLLYVIKCMLLEKNGLSIILMSYFYCKLLQDKNGKKKKVNMKTIRYAGKFFMKENFVDLLTNMCLPKAAVNKDQLEMAINLVIMGYESIETDKQKISLIISKLEIWRDQEVRNNLTVNVIDKAQVKPLIEEYVEAKEDVKEKDGMLLLLRKIEQKYNENISTINEMKKRIDDKNKEICDLNENNKKNTKEIVDMELSLKDKSEMILFLEMKIEKAKKDCSNLEVKISKTLEEKQAEIKRLKIQNEHHSRYLLNEYKRMLSEKLKTEWQEYSDGLNDHATIESGIYFYKQLGKVFKILKSTGVEL